MTKLITIDGTLPPASPNAAAEWILVQQLDGFHAHTNDLVATDAEAVPTGAMKPVNAMHLHSDGTL